MRTLEPTRKSKSSCDILLAVDAYVPWSGGSRIYYDNLYRRLADQHGLSVRVETSCCVGDAEFDANCKSPGLQIRRQGSRFADWKVKRAPALAIRMTRIVCAGTRVAPAAVHCGDLFPQDLAGLLLNKVVGLPFLVFAHGDELSQTEGRRLQPRIRDAIYRNAGAIVAANTFAYDRVVKICGGDERVTMITPGVDCAAFCPGERPDWIARKYELGQCPVVATVGRLVKKKGHATVLRALPAVLERIPDVKYLIVGGGPEEMRLESLVGELGIDRSVRFIGDVPHHQLAGFYRAADVFCMVNQQDASGDIESFGMVFIEAGASAKPVIGGRSGGTVQSIIHGQTGFLCEPEDPARLSEMLLFLFGNGDLRHRMGETGLLRARRDFDWDVRARQLFEVHQRMTRASQVNSRARQSCTVR